MHSLCHIRSPADLPYSDIIYVSLPAHPSYLERLPLSCKASADLKPRSSEALTLTRLKALISKDARHSCVVFPVSIFSFNCITQILTHFSTALDAMDKLKDKIKSMLGSKKSPAKTEKPAEATPTNGTTKPTPTDTAAAPSTSEPTAPPAGKNRLRRLSDKTTLVDLFSGAAPVDTKAAEPVAPAPGATPATKDAPAAVATS